MSRDHLSCLQPLHKSELFVTDLPFLTPLSPEQLRAAGVPDGWSFGMADIVRFHELDALNHVNNVAYFRWFETLRIPYF